MSERARKGERILMYMYVHFNVQMIPHLILPMPLVGVDLSSGPVSVS